jgi:hypothetical protein
VESLFHWRPLSSCTYLHTESGRARVLVLSLEHFQCEHTRNKDLPISWLGEIYKLQLLLFYFFINQNVSQKNTLVVRLHLKDKMILFYLIFSDVVIHPEFLAVLVFDLDCKCYLQCSMINMLSKTERYTM